MSSNGNWHWDTSRVGGPCDDTGSTTHTYKHTLRVPLVSPGPCGECLHSLGLGKLLSSSSSPSVKNAPKQWESTAKSCLLSTLLAQIACFWRNLKYLHFLILIWIVKKLKKFFQATEGKIRFWCRDCIMLYTYSNTWVHVNNCVCKYLCFSNSIDCSPQLVASDLSHLSRLCIAKSDMPKQREQKEPILLFWTNACNFHFSVSFCIVLTMPVSTLKSITILYDCKSLPLWNPSTN